MVCTRVQQYRTLNAHVLKFAIIKKTSSFARFARSATSPSFAYLSNLVPDSSLCRAAAPRLRPLQLLLAACVRFESAAAPGPDCIRFNCCSPGRPVCVRFQLLLPDCARFSCCCCMHTCHLRPHQLLFPIASASAAAPRLRPLRLLLPDCMQPQLDSSPMFSNILRGVRGSVNKLKYKGHASL